MKKLLSLLAAFSLVLTLAACKPEEKIVYVDVPGETVEVEKEPIEIPAVVDMANIDMFLERENVQLVDLRNWTDKMASGYIDGFEFIPFFDYLEASEVLVRVNKWTFEDAAVKDADILENFFDKDADAIFLMCGSGTRAGFVKSALESLGYTNVYNAGGISDYKGANKVMGDDTYGKLPTEVTMDNVDKVLNAKGVQLIDLRDWQDKMNSGYIAGFEFIPFFNYLEASEVLVRVNKWTFEEAAIKDADILENFFDKDAKAIYLMCGSGTRAGFVKAALESLGYTNVHNVGGIADYKGENRVMGDGSYKFPAA